MVLMNQQKIQLTQEGYDKLVAELEKLKTVDRIKNLEDLKEARAQGDLSENADYDAARDQQREIEKKIKELEITLKNAVVITTSSTNLGKKIKFEVIGVNEPDLFGDGEFLLVSSIESNPFDPVTPKISNESQAHIPIVGVYGAIPADDQYFEKQAEKVKVILDNAGVNPNDKPIYIIDGQVQGDDFDINCLNPNFIGKVVVWTPENAEKEFGEKGKNGVVEITAKEPVTIDSTVDGSVKVQYIGADGTLEGSEVPQPLYVIDGQVMPEDYNLNAINPEDIESISVLKDGKQTEVYGERAKDGVICITLKKKEEEKPVRFIPVSEPVGDLEEYAEFKLYRAGVFGRVISRKECESIPNEALAYLYVKHLDNGKKSLHVYTLDYYSIVHLRKCKKTTDINDEKLAGVNEETVILVDGKWDNYEGYLRTLKFRSNKIKEIEYCLKKDKKSVSMISVIFDKEYDDEEYTIRN